MEKFILEIDGIQYEIEIGESGSDHLFVKVNGQAHRVTVKDFPPALPSRTVKPQTNSLAVKPDVPGTAARQPGLVSSPMPGDIVSIAVKPGEEISIGQELLVLEAMKMKNVIRSPQAGEIASIEVTVGQSLKYGEPLVRFK